MSLAEPNEDIGQPERRHEQNDVGLIDQRAQHQPLDREREPEHHRDGQAERDKRRHAALIEADQCERGEHHHDALREVEYAGCFEDQHEAERNQRVQNTGNQPLPQRLHQQIRRRAHLHERIEEDLVEQDHAASR